MNVAELQAIIDKARTLGFKDDEVVVEFTSGFNKLQIREASAVVKATDKTAKPVLKVEMFSPAGSYYYEDRR